MDTKNALQIITNALKIANKAGVFELQDSATVFAALLAIKKEIEPQEEAVDKPAEDVAGE